MISGGRSRAPITPWPARSRSPAGVLSVEPELVATRPGQTLLADKHYYGREFEAVLAELGVRLLRPARKGESERPGARLFKPLRQLIESVNDTFKGQLDL
jgi:hypothetical protein